MACTHYEVVRKVAHKVLQWHLCYKREDDVGAVRYGQRNLKLSPVYDLTWHDTAVQPEFFSKLLPYQKVNMYPGINVLTKKHHLARNLMRMAKFMPEEYDFFPKTWILPMQTNELKTHGRQNQSLHKREQMTYIVKPDSMC